MARFVTFNGITMYHPGALSSVDVAAMAQTNPGVSGIVGLIGEAEAGEAATAYFIDEPGLAKTIFKSGELADAVRLAFEPANDPRVAGGANRVVAVKVNPSTQSTATFAGQVALGTQLESQLTLTSVEYGTGANSITWSFEADTISTNKYQCAISQGSTTESISDIGGTPLMNLQFKGPEAHNVLYTGTTTGPGTATTLVDTAVTAAEAYDGGWVRIISSGTASIVGEYRRISSFGAPTITVSSGVAADGFSAVVPAGTVYEIVKERIFDGAITNVTNVAPNAHVELSAATAGGGIEIYLDAAKSAQLVGTFIRVLDGNGQGQIRTIKAITCGAGATVDLTLADNDLFDVVPAVGDRITWIDCTNAEGKITGASGVATVLQTEYTWGDSGKGVTVNPDLNITFATDLPAAQRVDDLISAINNTPAVVGQPYGSYYYAEAGAGRATNVADSVQEFDFDTKNNGSVATTVDLRADFNLDLEDRARFLDDLNQVIEAVNTHSTLVTATRATTGGPTPANIGAGVPIIVPSTAPYTLTGAVYGTVTNTTWQNAFDEMLRHRRDYVVPLQSEDKGTVLVNTIHTMLLSHVQTSRGIGKNECVGIASLKDVGSSARANIIARANALNDPDIALVYQGPQSLDVDSDPLDFEPWGHAVLAAGMSAGLVIGEPITFKYLKANGVLDNSTNADSSDVTTQNLFLQGGVLFSEFVRGRGYRWVRGLTTWVTNDNLAYTDISCRVVLNFISYDLRTDLENEFTGLKGTPGRIADIKARVHAKLESYRQLGYIVDSKDPVTGANQNAYFGVTVTLCGDIAQVTASVYVATGINFETLELRAQLPVLSA